MASTKTVVLLTRDSRMVSQVRTWLGELQEQTILVPLESMDKFASRFGGIAGEAPVEEDSEASDAAANDADSDSEGEESSAAAASAPLRLLILDSEVLSVPPSEIKKLIVDIKSGLKERGYCDPVEPLRVMVIAFENSDGTTPVDALRFSVVDDLMLKPLDQSLFQQKAEMLLVDAGGSSGSFLYRQKVEELIEMGKDSFIDEISEHFVAIRNPAPLGEGLFARLYSDVFGEKGNGQIIGRSMRCIRHPSYSGQYLCYFSYFGIRQAQLLNVRKYIRGLGATKSESSSDSNLDGAAAGRVLKKVEKHVVVIDLNSDVRETIRECLTANSSEIKVHLFPSYSSFLKTLISYGDSLKASETASAAVEEVTEAKGAGASESVEGSKKKIPAFPSGASFTLIIDATSLNLLDTEPRHNDESRLFGLPFEGFRTDPQLWLRLIPETLHSELREFIDYVMTGQSGTLHLVVDNGKGSRFFLSCRGKAQKTESDKEGEGLVLRLDLRVLSDDERTAVEATLSNSMASGAAGRRLPFERLDALFIDGSFIRGESEPWITGLQEVLLKAQVQFGITGLPVLIMGEENTRVLPEKFLYKSFRSFLSKPIDRKFLLQEIATLFPSSDLARKNRVPQGQSCRLSVKVAKEVALEEFSEYGLLIRYGAALKPDVFARFFSPLFGEAQYSGVVGRCIWCRKDENTENTYHCFFMFFGVSDSLLKHIRTRIRDEYVSKKDQGAG